MTRPRQRRFFTFGQKTLVEYTCWCCCACIFFRLCLDREIDGHSECDRQLSRIRRRGLKQKDNDIRQKTPDVYPRQRRRNGTLPAQHDVDKSVNGKRNTVSAPSKASNFTREITRGMTRGPCIMVWSQPNRRRISVEIIKLII